jgi:hypothetical protein
VKKTFYHPASGAAILLLDWLFFGVEWELGPVTLVVSCVLAAAAAFSAVAYVQERWHGDEPRVARAKAALGAVAAGVPFAVGGTALGGLILVLSGLNRLGAKLQRLGLGPKPR